MAREPRSGGGVASARVHLCGELAVEWDGEVLTDRLPGRHGRLLFAYLVLNRHRPVRRDELEEALGTSQLAPPLSRLRKALGPGRVEGRGDVRLSLPPDAWVDWEAAHEALGRARAAIGARSWADAWGPASAARAIADRGLLPGLDAEWIEPLRAELAELRVEALETLARVGAELGGEELGPAEQAARAAVEAAPFRESARAALMDVLAARGNVAEALLAFESARTLLREELGATPGPELVARHEALLRGERGSDPLSPAAREGSDPLSRGDLDLLEREREIAVLGGVLGAAGSGEGGVLVVEGPAGVGKTRLLDELRRQGAERGLRVLHARAGELERDFPFGVVRQLFEGELAAGGPELLAGAAAPAAAVLGVSGDGPGISFAALHGLYWLALNLAGERATVLAVDDVQWCDPASLRFLVYLARRLEGVPLLVAASLRTGEQPADAALLDELLGDPATRALHPGPLSADAAPALIRDVLGAEPAPAFAAACHDATGGNPLLFRRLLTALRDDGVAPAAAGIPAVAEIGVRAVSRSVLARLPAGTAEVARAVAILGEGARLPDVAALAGLDERAAADAVAALTRAEILRPEAALGFVHPLVRDAVYDDLSPAEREARHGEAARLLAGRGAAADAVALHLLLVAPRGDAWTAETLRDAGRGALARGAVESALAHLRRALAEPPPPDERPALLLELGQVEREADAPAAAAHLREATAALADPRERAEAAEALVWTLCFVGPPQEAVSVGQEVVAELPPDLGDERLRVEALARFTGYWYGVAGDTERFEEWRREPPHGDGPGVRMAAAAAAWQWAVSDGPADQCVALARRALADDTLLTHDPALMSVAAASVLAMADTEDALAPWDRLRTLAHDRGSAMVKVPIDLWRGWALARRGALAEAEVALREALAGQVLWGLGAEVRAYTVGLAAETLLERGDREGVRALVEGAVEPPPGSDLRTFLLTGRAQLALADGDPERALAATDELAERPGPIANPAWVRWRSARALALHALGRREEAVALAWEDLGYAKRWGAPGTVGRALRVLGTVEGGEDRLREAVTVLEGSLARLELARALAASGEATLALRLARECGATALQAELEAAGAEEPAGSGITSLEREVADLASSGLDVNAIAQALFLTPKIAEDHLASAVRKLRLSGSEGLPAGPAAAP